MVRHLTRILVASASPEVAERLAALGFRVRWDGDELVAESQLVDADEARRHLHALGVRDGTYRVWIEYERAWGYL